MNILINHRFIGPLLDGRKIHTIRQNYNFWKRHDGKTCTIRTWEGRPYRSKQRDICQKTIYVQPILITHDETSNGNKILPRFLGKNGGIDTFILAMNDGFFDDKRNVCEDDFIDWFYDYPDGVLAVLHFTEYRY
jgi:hypothetical protein